MYPKYIVGCAFYPPLGALGTLAIKNCIPGTKGLMKLGHVGDKMVNACTMGCMGRELTSINDIRIISYLLSKGIRFGIP
jgi:hypothetical protein